MMRDGAQTECVPPIHGLGQRKAGMDSFAQQLDAGGGGPVVVKREVPPPLLLKNVSLFLHRLRQSCLFAVN